MSAFNTRTHLGAFLFREHHFRPNGLIGFVDLEILEAWVDASGKDETKTDRILTINGVLGTPDAWKEFDIEWQAFLKDAGFKRHHKPPHKYVFHTAPFWANDCIRMPKGLTFSDKKNIYRQLVDIVCKYRVSIFGHGVLLNDYRRVEAEFPHIRKLYLGSPGAFLTNLCIKWNSRWAHFNDFNSSIGYTFDQGDGFLKEVQAQFLSVLAKENVEDMAISGLHFGSSAEFSPLQAADIVAWECRKYWIDSRIHPVRSLAAGLRPSCELTRLIGKVNSIKLYGYEHIKEELIEHWTDHFNWTPEIEAEITQAGVSIEEYIHHILILAKEKQDEEKGKTV